MTDAERNAVAWAKADAQAGAAAERAVRDATVHFDESPWYILCPHCRGYSKPGSFLEYEQAYVCRRCNNLILKTFAEFAVPLDPTLPMEPRDHSYDVPCSNREETP